MPTCITQPAATHPRKDALIFHALTLFNLAARHGFPSNNLRLEIAKLLFPFWSPSRYSTNPHPPVLPPHLKIAVKGGRGVAERCSRESNFHAGGADHAGTGRYDYKAAMTYDETRVLLVYGWGKRGDSS
ncbi:hypothetical protein CDAR_368211 [Caerostris darwini]|uniref:Uncharacterized protein n=1 Tax=Caerostris darwini TaxID=1538125 RepID=A0AAV4WFZ2_9ARAC|nr:hypothetical protein CDAR_368211 [Caerostris darwini]